MEMRNSMFKGALVQKRFAIVLGACVLALSSISAYAQQADDSARVGRSRWSYDLREWIRRDTPPPPAPIDPPPPPQQGFSDLGTMEFAYGQTYSFTNGTNFAVQVEVRGYGKCVGMDVTTPQGLRQFNNSCRSGDQTTSFMVLPGQSWSLYHINSGSPPVGASAHVTAFAANKNMSHLGWLGWQYQEVVEGAAISFFCPNYVQYDFMTFDVVTGTLTPILVNPRLPFREYWNTYDSIRVDRVYTNNVREVHVRYNRMSTSCPT
jgi:hypothetical protein